MLCPIRFNSNTIELTVPTSCYLVLDLICVKGTMSVYAVEHYAVRQRLPAAGRVWAPEEVQTGKKYFL